MSDSLRTPLYPAHVRHEAKLVPFAGYDMPLQYSSIRLEHQAVRERAGLFDVSHMAQIHLSGPTANESAEALLTCEVASLGVDRARYGLMLNDAGGCVDDVMLTREGPEELFVCVNAANHEKALAWIRDRVQAETRVEDRSRETALLALQGPAAAAVLGSLGPAREDLPKRFRVRRLELAGSNVLVSATGYTGAPGFELYVAAERAESLFEAILEAGTDEGVVPAGLGARDTLRLEAALPLYGHELDETTTPIEAGLSRFVKPLSVGFIGAEALSAESSDDPNARRLVGFEMIARGIARADYEIVHDDAIVGRVTSGAPSPSLGKSIGLGYVPRVLSEVGQEFAIRIRGKDVAARVVETPFLR